MKNPRYRRREGQAVSAEIEQQLADHHEYLAVDVPEMLAFERELIEAAREWFLFKEEEEAWNEYIDSDWKGFEEDPDFLDDYDDDPRDIFDDDYMIVINDYAVVN
jgi:hypothetical protein